MRKSVRMGIASAGLLLIGTPAAANGEMSSFGNAGVANGIQVKVPIQVPVNFCGNAIGILGDAAATCMKDTAAAGLGGDGHMHRHKPYGGDIKGIPTRLAPSRAASPDASPKASRKASPKARPAAAKRNAPEQSPITQLLSPLTGLLGTDGTGGPSAHPGCHADDVDPALNAGIANGIQAYVPVQVPVNFTGNGIGVLGSAVGSSTNTSAVAKHC